MGIGALIAGLAILGLLVASALLSCAETALSAASRPRMHALARKGNRRAILVNALRERRGTMISALLIGNNLVNILASAIATGLLVSLFGAAGVAYATVGMTVMVVIFGEVLPKTLALNRPDRLALALAPMVETLLAVLGPLARAASAVARTVLRRFGADAAERGAQAAQEELRGAIELHAHAGPAEAPEGAMLRSILDLANVEVGQIMVHRRNVFAIDGDQKPEAILERALASQHTRIPLWRGQPDNIIGVLHAKALLRALRAQAGRPEAISIAQVMTRPWFIPESTTLLDQLQAFRRRREHFALVVDEYGALLGIVTLEDILEEIVGDIAETHEFRLPGVRPQPDGSFVVDGHVTIRDLNRQFDWRLPDEEASTIAGLVLHESRTIPEIGQTFSFHGFRFEILRRRRHQILSLRIAPVGRPASAA